VNDVLAACALLTIVPLRRALQFSARALFYFPLIGALLGLVLVGVFLVSRVVFPASVTAALIVALWALLTGALHLDGVSDACDALAAATRERRLEILRDTHLGAFGATGLILLLLLKFSALSTISPAALFLAPVLGRWAMVYAAAFPLARSEGMAALFAKSLTRRELLGATGLAFVLVAPFGWLGMSAWLTAVIIATLLARFAMARLGGLTGDIYGLICESVEVSVLLAGIATAAIL
jgi:adenosylcobinamide-GDP ribazoletransferase